MDALVGASGTTSNGFIDFYSNKTQLTSDDFEFGKYLGKGAYGQVYLARKKSGEDAGTIVAMKVISKYKVKHNQWKINNIRGERCILAGIKHPFIIKLFYAFETNHTFFLGLEYMPNGDLQRLLCKSVYFNENTARLYSAEIILALQYLHKNCIIFRDLKPENILLDAGGHAKLSDFGFAKQLSSQDDKTTSFCGTANYMAPEVIKHKLYTRAVDWWSLGVILFKMITGSRPFDVCDDRQRTMQKIVSGEFSFDNKRAVLVSPEAQDLIRKLLKLNPAERLGAGETDARELMDHVFFNNINFDDLLACKYEPLTRKRKRTPPFKEIIRTKIRPYHDPRADSHEMIFEDFDYIAPSWLDPQEDSDVTRLREFYKFVQLLIYAINNFD
ncbi:ribosomal protein S6 kinase beta-2 [Nasonia vitripennis]|uniref:Protein kinase domain-containing protein n=1 Tax=Nasonia vitripennis TaxID=7425 RepID=A0A7M7T7C2_NASVI|nr:ribosomal protein S6 kinase beta-2 [Nasonia vitripennis]